MADDKKDKKEAPKKDYFEEAVFYLICAFIVVAFFSRINFYLQYFNLGDYHTVWGRIVGFFTFTIWPIVKILGVIIFILAVWGIIHVMREFRKIVEEEHAIYGAGPKKEGSVAEAMKNDKWDRVITHINSSQSSDWKLAIIEADIMLDELLKAAGYHGDSLGERLKAVDKSDFLTLDYAWEAHKVRNQIAHQGADFDLTERDAKHVVSLYEAVFKEFKII